MYAPMTRFGSRNPLLAAAVHPQCIVQNARSGQGLGDEEDSLPTPLELAELVTALVGEASSPTRELRLSAARRITVIDCEHERMYMPDEYVLHRLRR